LHVRVNELQAVSALEAGIGEKLFVRDVRPARVTDHAKRILSHAQEILEISQKIIPTAAVKHAKALEKLRFGTNSSLVSGWLPGITDRLCKTLNNISLEFEVDISQHLHDKMRSGMLDICLMITSSDIFPALGLGLITNN
jgi:DNA-binding transcriptional LysR family regulator